jgi:hypothetical protein
VYRIENSEIFYPQVNEYDRNDASCVGILREVFKNTDELKVLKIDLACIHATFSFLSYSVMKSEMNINLLSETIKETGDTQKLSDKISGLVVGAGKQNISCVLFRIKGYSHV